MNNIKVRLTILSFLQFFIWGAWLISLGAYMSRTLGFTGSEIGSVYATMGIASVIMPGIMGILADKWINGERLLGICHLIGGGLSIWAASVASPQAMFWVMLLNMLMYMPTLALSNAVSYNILTKNGLDPIKDFPPIRVFGTVGFIAAMWVVDLMGLTLSPMQLYVSAATSFIMFFYALTMPACPPAKTQKTTSFASIFGLDAFVLFKRRKMMIFFIFALLLGAALQITNTFGVPFLDSFKDQSQYAGTFTVKHPNILMSISQMSETLFILCIPFFMKRFGIKNVMLLSMFAWVLRFGLFGIGNPGDGVIFLILSMIIYGMAFDFFNISGSLFVETESSPETRASAQGLFMIMTNGIGAIIGAKASGWIVDYFTIDGIQNWEYIWFVFAGYALVIGIAFAFIFKSEK